jgi:hypothetical protein
MLSRMDVQPHSGSRELIVGAFRRQFVLASAITAAMTLFCSAPARAGYVSVHEIVEHDGGGSLTQLPVSPLSDLQSSAGWSGASIASPSRRDIDKPHVPSDPVLPSRKLPDAAHNFGQGSGAGSSSSSSSNGPSSSFATDLSRPQVPPQELSGLLPPQTGDSHVFSMNSFLFRPPRIS